MSDFFATEDDYDRLVEKVGPSRAAEIARNEGWQVRPKEVNFTPAMGGGDQMEDEDLNVATEDAADQDAAGSEGQYAGGLDAVNMGNPQDISKAILANARAQKQYYDQLAEQIKNRRYGPSESEKLFALSAALFSPTRVRGLSGTMGNVMPVLQKFGELRRTGEEERTQALQELAKQRMQLAQGDVKTALELQRLMASYNKPQPLVVPPGSTIVDRRDPSKIYQKTPGVSEEVVELPQGTFIKGPKGLTPITPKRKWRAATPAEAAQFGAQAGQIDETTGEFKASTAQPRKLGSAETKELLETEDLINRGTSSIGILQQALDLNSTAYEGSLSGARKALGSLFASDSPEYVATENLDNLITGQALESLKATFGAAPTEGERKILLDLQASSGKPRAVREQIYRRALALAQKRLGQNTQRVNRLKEGYYSKPTGGSAPVIRFDKKGNRIQ